MSNQSQRTPAAVIAAAAARLADAQEKLARRQSLVGLPCPTNACTVKSLEAEAAFHDDDGKVRCAEHKKALGRSYKLAESIRHWERVVEERSAFLAECRRLSEVDSEFADAERAIINTQLRPLLDARADARKDLEEKSGAKVALEADLATVGESVDEATQAAKAAYEALAKATVEDDAEAVGVLQEERDRTTAKHAEAKAAFEAVEEQLEMAEQSTKRAERVRSEAERACFPFFDLLDCLTRPRRERPAPQPRPARQQSTETQRQLRARQQLQQGHGGPREDGVDRKAALAAIRAAKAAHRPAPTPVTDADGAVIGSKTASGGFVSADA